MHYIIAKDNLNRDYHNDKLMAMRQLNQTVEDMETLCTLGNNLPNQSQYLCVVDSLDQMNFESMYDCNGDIPSFNTFCNYTGLGILPHDQAEIIYKSHFNL